MDNNFICYEFYCEGQIVFCMKKEDRVKKLLFISNKAIYCYCYHEYDKKGIISLLFLLYFHKKALWQ